MHDPQALPGEEEGGADEEDDEELEGRAEPPWGGQGSHGCLQAH